MIKIIHILRDHQICQTFIDEVGAPIDPRYGEYYYILGEVDLLSTRYLRHCDVLRGRVVSDLDDADLLVCHGLDYDAIDAIGVYKSKPLVWLMWGYEYLDLCYEQKGSSLRTHKTDLLLQEIKASAPNRLKSFRRMLRKKPLLSTSQTKSERAYQALEEMLPFVDAFCVSWFSDIELIEEVFDVTIDSNKKKTFSYYQAVRENGTRFEYDFLIGHSLSAENNHIDAIDFIDALQVNSCRALCPMSYGGDPAYGDLIRRQIVLKLPQYEVEVLDAVMPIDEYRQRLAGCKVVLLPSLRQKGFGSILHSICNGAYVVLDHRNPIYHYLCELGFQVGCFQKVSETVATTRSIISREISLDCNVALAADMFSLMNVRTKYRGILNSFFELK